MFTLLLGYMLGVATTYYFEDIFNYNISSVNLKTKLNTVLQNTVYNHIDTFETNNKKLHETTQDLLEDQVYEQLESILNSIKHLTCIVENKDTWHNEIKRASP